MDDSIGVRDLLWEWSRAYPERAGDSVSWPRLSAFGREMASGHRENSEPIDYDQAEETDKAVLAYLNAIRKRRDTERAILEGAVFWLRYYYRWERPDIARKLKRSKAWVDSMCQLVESSVEMIYLMRQDAA